MKVRIKGLVLLGAFFVLPYLNAQDTVTVMQYNLLNYGNNTSYCDQNNNNIDTKNENIRVLLNYITPDIISVNEMASDSYKAIYLLNNALNTDGRTFYKNASMTNLSGSGIVNMLYYNSEKFTLAYQEAIGTSLRDINVYHLYYNSPDLAQGDTAWLTCIVAHLKAGSYSSDAATRADMTATLMDYVSNHNIDGNVLIMGDMNLYSSSEEAYQNMVNYSVERFRVYDPVNMSGNWSNNSYYAMYHSQSTHATSNDCFASGGLDDRFDFILISEEVRDDLMKIKYVPSSFKVIGQDGQHFNASIIDNPANSLYPEELVDALYQISDHLPVTLKLEIEQTPVNGINEADAGDPIRVSTLVTDKIHVDAGRAVKVTYELYDAVGRKIGEGEKNGQFDLDVRNFKRGLYFLRLHTDNMAVMYKVVKQ